MDSPRNAAHALLRNGSPPLINNGIPAGVAGQGGGPEPAASAIAAGPGRMVRATLRVVRHEPLVHFFLLGGLIFAADAVLHPPDRNDRVITVTPAMRQAMSENFDEDRERKATGTELDAMVENWVASEILYREGKALGVDRGDDTIRDRIAFKLQLLIFSQIDAPPATEAGLRAWFAANHDRFDEPERLSFYLGPPTDEMTARRQLAEVLGGREPADLQRKTRAMVGRPVSSLAPSFGAGFRDGLLALPQEQWATLQSVEGWHLVRIDSRRPAVLAHFEDVQDEAVRTWKTDETRKRAWEAVKRLRANYTVRYEP